MPKIDIKGDIVDNDTAWIYDWFGIEHVSPSRVLQEINEANGEPIELEISSNGGDVIAASEIYTALRSYQGTVSGNIVGLAASAASVISCACQPLRISPTAHLMIHNSWLTSSGNKHDKQQDSELLNSVDESIVNAYEQKTGQSREVLSELMDKDTWLNAKTATEYGFVDEVMFEEALQIANASSQLIPKSAVSKLKNLIIQKDLQASKDKNDELSLMQRKINLLKGE